MDRREQAALLVVLRRSSMPWTEVRTKVEYAGSVSAVIEELAHPATPTLDEAAFDLDAAVHNAQTEIEQWSAEGIELVTVLDDVYPWQLRAVHDHPPFLLYRGTLDLRDAEGVAVVGTRQATSHGLQLATEVATALTRVGRPVVSGLAAGIDGAAHRAALGHGGRTIAVVGTGLRHVYPAAHRQLQDEIADRGVVLSQFWPDATPSRRTFPMRNAVMSGFSLATVVIEASQTSGARMQAGLALKHNRPVILMSRLLAHDWAHELATRPGVSVAASADDVISALADISELQNAELNWV
jgi:DNA processing protein